MANGATAVIRYGSDVCQNWRTAALQYGWEYANTRFPSCRNGILQGGNGFVPAPAGGIITTTVPNGAPLAPPAPNGALARGGCGRCGAAALAPGVVQTEPATPLTVAAAAEAGVRIPWWLYVLGLLALSGALK